MSGDLMRVAGVEDGARGVEAGGAHPRSVSACTNCCRISPECWPLWELGQLEDWTVGVETGEVFLGPPCLHLHNVPMHCRQSSRYVKKWTSFFSNQLSVLKYCQDLHQAPVSSGDEPDQ